VAKAIIYSFNTQTMHSKKLYTQQHGHVSLKELIPSQDSNLGLPVPEAPAMFIAPRRQGKYLPICCPLCN
jgi:hypothetical protein